MELRVATNGDATPAADTSRPTSSTDDMTAQGSARGSGMGKELELPAISDDGYTAKRSLHVEVLVAWRSELTGPDPVLCRRKEAERSQR